MKFDSNIIEHFSRSEDVLSVRFQRPKGFNFTPGQFIFLHLDKPDESLVKHFTISSSPSEDYLEITKKLTGHPFSNALLALQIGDTVSLDGPYGEFTNTGENQKLLFITGGIGITPIRSMIRYSVDMKTNDDMVLLYSCKTEDSILFREELDEIREEHRKLSVIYTLTQPQGKWNGVRGRIDGEMIRKHIPDYSSRVSYISGPPGMVESLVNVLINELNVPSEQIKKEQFLGL